MASVSYQRAADQLSTAALQSHVALPASLQLYTTGLDDLTQSSSAAVAARRQQTVSTLQQQALYNKVNLVATLNESANANDYINRVLTTEGARVAALQDTVKREQYMLRSKMLMDNYLGGYYRTATWVVLLTIVVTIVLMTPAALWRAGGMSMMWFSVIVLVVLLLYLIAIVLVSAKAAMRRYDGWDQFNWPLTPDMAKQIKDASAASTLRSECAASDEIATPSCSDSCNKYASLYKDMINVWQTKNSSWTSKLSSPTIIPWAHYVVEGKNMKNVWPGDGCNIVASCSDATYIYKAMYTVPAGTTAYNHHQQNPNKVWAGADGTPC